MEKVFRPLFTKGIKGLIEENLITEKTLAAMFQIAKVLYEKDYFISFIKEVNKVKITDGNDTIFTELDLKEMIIPEDIWLVTDDYGKELVCTALLPKEY